MENNFIFYVAIFGFAFMTLITLFSLRYAAKVKEDSIGLKNWGEWQKWKKQKDDIIMQHTNWESVLDEIELAASKREVNPNAFPDPVKALSIQLTNDYTLTRNE